MTDPNIINAIREVNQSIEHLGLYLMCCMIGVAGGMLANSFFNWMKRRRSSLDCRTWLKNRRKQEEAK